MIVNGKIVVEKATVTMAPGQGKSSVGPSKEISDVLHAHLGAGFLEAGLNLEHAPRICRHTNVRAGGEQVINFALL